MVIWVQSLTETNEDSTRCVVEALQRKGIETREYDRSFQPTPGVLLIDSYNETVCKFVRDATCCANPRVLVLATAKCALGREGSWELLRAGASDVMVWDGRPEAIDNVEARLDRWNTVDELLDSPVVKENLIGQSPTWIKVLRQAVEEARFTSASVLVMGESGTGKELIARLIHTLDPRPKKGELIVLDCTTVVPELSGSE